MSLKSSLWVLTHNKGRINIGRDRALRVLKSWYYENPREFMTKLQRHTEADTNTENDDRSIINVRHCEQSDPFTESSLQTLTEYSPSSSAEQWCAGISTHCPDPPSSAAELEVTGNTTATACPDVISNLLPPLNNTHDKPAMAFSDSLDSMPVLDWWFGFNSSGIAASNIDAIGGLADSPTAWNTFLDLDVGFDTVPTTSQFSQESSLPFNLTANETLPIDDHDDLNWLDFIDFVC
jgi:hypothetical protein